MKVLVEQAHLADVFGFVRARAASSLKIPILHNVFIEAKDGKVRMLGHNIDSSSEAYGPAEVSEPGACTVPADRFGVLLNGLPKGCQILITSDERGAEIRFGHSKYRLPVLPADQFPSMLANEEDGETHFVHIKKAQIESLFACPRGIISLKENRIQYTGVYLHRTMNGKIATATSDGRVLLRFTGAEQKDECSGIIIPKRSVDELVKLADEDGILLRWTDRILTASPARSSDRAFASKLVDAIFPDYENHVPIILKSDNRIAVDRVELIAAIERLNAVVTDDRVAVTIKWDGEDRITASLSSSEGNGEERIAADILGMEPGYFKVHCDYLTTALGTMRCEMALLHLNGEGKNKSLRIVDQTNPDSIVMLALIGE